MKPEQIFIVGAGISGLSLAINLKMMNIPFRIIEKQAKWNKGEITLIGEACHSLSSLSGLGANLAMADAAGLAQLIKESETDYDLPGRLEVFNQKRKIEADKAYSISKFRTRRSMLNFPETLLRNRDMKRSGWEY